MSGLAGARLAWEGVAQRRSFDSEAKREATQRARALSRVRAPLLDLVYALVEARVVQ